MPENVSLSDKTQIQQAIERAQENGLAKLREAHPTVQQSLLVSKSIASLCLESLRIADQIYMEFEEYVSRDGRSERHQQWLQDRAGWLLRQVELGIDASVQTGIRHIGTDLTTPRQVTPKVIVQPAPDWDKQFKLPLRFLSFGFVLGVITIVAALSC